MARKSKYEPQKLSTVLWKPALYIRLSREDGDSEESNSIISQRELLTEFADTQTDMTASRLYVDDGYTGTDFDRPDFRRMMHDLRAGIVNCVIVKDLSRLGRNYVKVGEYLEHTFPLLNVRFIALSERIDSVADPRSADSLIVPFRNILNDEYAHDISNKVRASLDLKRRQGKFIGSFASYGYRKDPDDHSRLLIDEAAAAVVRDIFQLVHRRNERTRHRKATERTGRPESIRLQAAARHELPPSDLGQAGRSVAGQLSAPYPAQSAVHRHYGAGQKTHEKLQAACQRGRARG